ILWPFAASMLASTSDAQCVRRALGGASSVMYTADASHATKPVRSPAKTLCMRRSAVPVSLVLALIPTRQIGCTKVASALIILLRLVSAAPPAPLVTDRFADHGPSSNPTSTPSSEELKFTPENWR